MTHPPHEPIEPRHDHDLDRRDEDDPRLPSTNQPLNAEPRPRFTPILGVVAMVVVVLLVFAVITWLRYNS